MVWMLPNSWLSSSQNAQSLSIPTMGAGQMMIGEFELAGCNARRVAPLGPDWIESYWAEVVQSLLA